MSDDVPIQIREMRASDMPFIQAGLSETNWQDIPDDQKALLRRAECDERMFEDFERYLKNPQFKFKVFVAELENGDLAGYVSIGELKNPTVGLPMGGIIDFWVAPSLRRRGIGSRLLGFAMDQIKSLGYSHASLFVSSTNTEAIRLYKERGFVPERLILSKKL